MHNVLNILASFAAIYAARLNVKNLYIIERTQEFTSAFRFKIMGEAINGYR